MPRSSMNVAATACSLLLVGCIGAALAQCPPEGYNSVSPFSIDAYIGADRTPWYIQQQQAISYQPEESLFCVRARYERLDK